MQYALWTVLCLIAYGAGLTLLVRVTPRLATHAFEDSLFMGFAALDILGALLAFGAFIVTYGLFSGNIPIKIVDFLMLAGIIIVAIRFSLASLRSRVLPDKTIQVSRIMAGSYGVLLILAALYCIFVLFTS